MEGPEFWERAVSLLAAVATPWLALVKCLDGVSSGDWLDGLPKGTRESLGLPQKPPSKTAVVGWSYDVRVALMTLREVAQVVGTSIGAVGLKRDLKPIAYREVERLQDAARTLRQEVRGSTPVGATEEPESGLTREAKALALLVQHPEWTDKAIAKAVPCNRTTVYKWGKYKKAREVLKAQRHEMPRGAKDKEGRLEAWEN